MQVWRNRWLYQTVSQAEFAAETESKSTERHTGGDKGNTNSEVVFSIPVAAVRQVVPKLVDNAEYVYPYMGASFDSEITLGERSTYGLSQIQGAYVVGVTQGSPADEAGLIPANRSTGRGGDLVVKIDEQEVSDFSDLNSYLVFYTTVGQTIEMTVLRDGEYVTLPLTLGARP